MLTYVATCRGGISPSAACDARARSGAWCASVGDGKQPVEHEVPRVHRADATQAEQKEYWGNIFGGYKAMYAGAGAPADTEEDEARAVYTNLTNLTRHRKQEALLVRCACVRARACGVTRVRMSCHS